MYQEFAWFSARPTQHAIMHLIDHINDNFENNQYTLGIFMDLSRDFDLVNHKILIAKLENYDNVN